MLMTSLLAFAVLPGKTTGLRRTVWLVLICGFLLMDVLLFSSNALKLFDGGWVPLLVGAALLTLMVTWKQGREKIHETLSGEHPPLKYFMEPLEDYPHPHLPGSAVFLSMLVNTNG